jgi:hypothetical protein
VLRFTACIWKHCPDSIVHDGSATITRASDSAVGS